MKPGRKIDPIIVAALITALSTIAAAVLAHILGG
jgi:hypothetical protein